MSELHKALEHLRPKDYGEVPLDNLSEYLTDLFSKAEFIANSVPPPPNGTPYEMAQRSRKDANGAVCAADLTISSVRRPEAVSKEQKELHKAWGRPLKLGAKETQTGISVFKMAGNDRHGAWFARTSVHEGLGFAKWKRAMMREFPESLETVGGPGAGSVRGIGGDQRLEDVEVEGIGKMEVYQLSAQFPGPTAAREFITLLLTSDNCLGEASKINNIIPRHYMVVSIPVEHPDAPVRSGFVRGQYESVEMIREIPLPSAKSAASASTSNLLKHDRKKSRDRGGTIGFAESRGPDAKGEMIDRKDDADEDDPEMNPVEWIMITRSDPGGGIPRFMVERGTPGSIVQDAGKFLDWACGKDDFPSGEEDEKIAQDSTRRSMDTEKHYSIANSNGVLAGVGTSIADRPNTAASQRLSQRTSSKQDEQGGIAQTVADTLESYVPDALNPLHRRDTISSTSSSSIDSFASAEQFTTAPDGLPIDDTIPTPSTSSEQSLALAQGESASAQSREIQKIEQKRQQLHERLKSARQQQTNMNAEISTRTSKELTKESKKHARERKKQEEKFAKEVQKLEARRERETKKLLARQQKEADKNNLSRIQRERDEWKDRAELAEQENKVLLEQIGELQRENTQLAAKMGKMEGGEEVLKAVREKVLAGAKGGRRAESRGSVGSGRIKVGSEKKSEGGSGLQNMESRGAR
ncbi:hypothetical protein CC80DRAFT_30130 [Byssothecium circinans]|uniref:DUF3074 domain-containing protein n=1 Tax=Byssothecium circinans TaxID=147558 RepID=A0A6A5U3H7_9PLEO|nr:hypothetical protein CC80DRAFT_30130 [Byssothecium circinans]